MTDLKDYFIQDVIIEGFKSFSEPTNMTFQPGINVIIGNNGVGKSNILDGIIWALGENDIAKLRCYKHDELFFWGSKDYPAANKISVELKIGEKPNLKKPSISVKRELFRNGSEICKINNSEISKTKFLEVLDSLGLKDITKTIVRQDKITELFYFDPVSRMNLLSRNYLPDGNNSLEFLSRQEPFFKNYLSTLNPRYDAKFILADNSFDIQVRSGGNTKMVHQMSGGEKSVVSLALKLAIFRGLRSPVYFLDEVEPSLDYVNHKSMQHLLKDISKERQLIIITHLRSTVEIADTLHGVRTRMDGSTFMKFYFVMDKRLLRLYKCC